MWDVARRENPVWKPEAEDDYRDVAEWVRRKLGFEPDADQQRALASLKKRGILNCTRQWGKSTITGGEAVHKLWLVFDAVRDHRTAAALVRIVASAAAGGDEQAFATAAQFARSAYPVLRKNLPR